MAMVVSNRWTTTTRRQNAAAAARAAIVPDTDNEAVTVVVGIVACIVADRCRENYEYITEKIYTDDIIIIIQWHFVRSVRAADIKNTYSTGSSETRHDVNGPRN